MNNAGFSHDFAQEAIKGTPPVAVAAPTPTIAKKIEEWDTKVHPTMGLQPVAAQS